MLPDTRNQQLWLWRTLGKLKAQGKCWERMYLDLLVVGLLVLWWLLFSCTTQAFPTPPESLNSSQLDFLQFHVRLTLITESQWHTQNTDSISQGNLHFRGQLPLQAGIHISERAGYLRICTRPFPKFWSSLGWPMNLGNHNPYSCNVIKWTQHRNSPHKERPTTEDRRSDRAPCSL